MFGLPLAFTAPAVLVALAALPVLYWLLRVTPPRPRALPFPPLRLILDQRPREETPSRTPPWLLLLRLLVAAAIVLAMAGPIWNPPPALGGGTGPLVILLDDGFAAAPGWDRRVAAASDRASAAERQGRPTVVLPFSDGARAVQPATASQTLERLRALKPQPVVPDRLAALPALEALLAASPDADVVWIADGLENGHAQAFAERLASLTTRHPATIVTAADTPVAVAGTDNQPDHLDVRLVRAGNGAPTEGRLHAYDLKGLPVGDADFRFGSTVETHATLTLPVELRNEIARVAVDGVASAGAVSLLDGRWKRRRVGLVSGTTADVAQPLLSPTFYLARALAPYADVREMRVGTADPLAALLDEKPSVMVLADLNVGPGADHDRLQKFVADGGVLVRFAGARLAGQADDLVPVALRRGGRSFGGALSWDQPKPLAPFDAKSPFAGLVPHDAVTVTRQVLAEPDPGIADKTWAQLTDGTPLVTAEKRGKGLVVLFHITADTTWSNLPLSGLFVAMLRRIVDLSGTVAPGGGDKAGASASEAATLAPSRILDGFGVLEAPPPAARPFVASAPPAVSLDHPPGFYGPADALVALNLFGPADTLTRFEASGLPFGRDSLLASEPIDLRAMLVTTALVLFLLDGLATLWLGGGLRRLRAGRPAAASVLILALAGALLWGPVRPAQAFDDGLAVSKQDMQSALSVRLATVMSGDAGLDAASLSGLTALSHALADRTSLTPGDPIGVDPSRDELSFYPLLYWPVSAAAPQPSAATKARVASYMKQGGTVVFDTRDALTQRPGGPPTPEGAWLRELLSGIDVPEVEPLPADHVVNRTFYILAGFVGRYATAPTWIEALPPPSANEAARPARAGDSVSPIVITGNDLAGAWAADADGQPLFPLVPGGARQRELALRGGINLVMYTLTGNYKADQVHVHDLLERLAR
ncbi:DUF4159 domain-containing protein [Lichenihabitans sp. Uapishka_5]|uniref:DUF4159 domain-containing protein n=1 Tax=Lichenihabitans sp. Uapishka_5 TaxID=3037302 RepID=UPI0029E7E72B|nr:DUF4159 domain-containing protein [Lichenihabitans sp. Uapishka_5]MDX7952720.1 DUF4159 domain-containing protein [Lichenihabitans sp. Uapishka_5]